MKHFWIFLVASMIAIPFSQDAYTQTTKQKAQLKKIITKVVKDLLPEPATYRAVSWKFEQTSNLECLTAEIDLKSNELALIEARKDYGQKDFIAQNAADSARAKAELDSLRTLVSEPENSNEICFYAITHYFRSKTKYGLDERVGIRFRVDGRMQYIDHEILE